MQSDRDHLAVTLQRLADTPDDTEAAITKLQHHRITHPHHPNPAGGQPAPAAGAGIPVDSQLLGDHRQQLKTQQEQHSAELASAAQQAQQAQREASLAAEQRQRQAADALHTATQQHAAQLQAMQVCVPIHSHGKLLQTLTWS